MNQETQKITAKRRLEGVVVSDKMQKTVVVNVARFRKHPKYQKYYKVSRRFKAHDENNEYKTGDKVIIEEMRPLSKGKRWKAVAKIGGSREPQQEEVAEEDSTEA